MSFGSERFTSRRDTIAFLVCILLSVVARIAPPGAQDAVASVVRQTVLAPFLALQEQAELMKASRTRYAQVVAERDSAVLAALVAQTLEEENASLRELLGLSRRLRTRHVAAEVLHQASPSDGFTLVLSAGRGEGVRPRAPVIAPGGLVGVVRGVDANSSVALVWTHPEFRVSAMTDDGEVFGIVAPWGAGGPNTLLLELRGVSYQDIVAPGTLLVTSGLGGADGVYPRGIPIGRVLRVAEEREGWSRSYVVRPAVHPAAVAHVIVLTAFAGAVRTAFDEDER